MTDLSKLAEFILSQKLLVSGLLPMTVQEITGHLEHLADTLLGDYVKPTSVHLSMEEDEYNTWLENCQKMLPSMYAELRGPAMPRSLACAPADLACAHVTRTPNMTVDERLREIVVLSIFYMVSAVVYLREARVVFAAVEALPQEVPDVPDYVGGRAVLTKATAAAGMAERLGKQIKDVETLFDEMSNGNLMDERRQ